MLANAIAGHLLYRSAFAGTGHEPILAATVLGLVVAGIAVQILIKPVSWALDLAREAAVGMLLASWPSDCSRSSRPTSRADCHHTGWAARPR
jgi:hypothetical protein